jgi:chromosome segregation ATPase
MLNLFFVKGYTMDLLQKYEELAKQLGDVTYKLLALQNKQQELLKEIKNLDEAVGIINAQKKEKNAQVGPTGISSIT